MTSLTGRVERQRALVRRLRAQMAFEALILVRLERRSRVGPDAAARDLASVLQRALERQAGNADGKEGGLSNETDREQRA